MSVRLDFVVAAVAETNETKLIWPGGTGFFAAQSTAWGGGSVKMQSKGPSGTYVDVAGVVLGADGFIEFDAARGSALKAVVTGAPTALNVTGVPL